MMIVEELGSVLEQKFLVFGRKSINIGFNCLLWTNIFYCLNSKIVQAQVVEDGTLSTEVTTDNNRDFTVNAGEQRGGNLFHSFEQFSIPQAGSISFDNALTIQNIITRVTGSSISEINGLIQSNGTASLFLINPNGIIFGENATLNIGGSFIGTTAESLVFEDGSQFSTNLEDSQPLLTMNVPLGLQFGSNPGEIVNRANFSVPNPLDPTGQSQRKLGLTTTPETTLALLGGDITFDGGAIALPAGNIELGSVADNSSISLSPTADKWNFNYDNVSQFRDLVFDNLASVDSSGRRAGDINVRGKRIQILNGSAITSNTLADLDGGTIRIQASDLLEVNGSDRTGTKIDPLLAGVDIFIPFSSQVSSNTLGAGKGGNIRIITQDLKLIDGGSIELTTFFGSQGTGGNLSISASGSVQLSGSKPLLRVGDNAQNQISPLLTLDEAIEFNLSSEIVALSTSSGDGGSIDIAAKNLKLLDGAVIGVSPFGSGDAGAINLQISESLEVIGTSPRSGSTSSVISATSFAAGSAGDININSNVLSLQDGGQIASSNFGDIGSTGDIMVNTNLTELSGISQSGRPSLLSTVTRNNTSGGGIEINTGSLMISDRALINIRGTASGSPGNLILNANNAKLSNNATISAENASAIEGGNINLQIQDNLTLEENSTISARASNSANGGNINIDANFLIALPNQNNDILADARTGNGGNINITALGVFGIAEGKSQPPNFSNDIDASSEFGLGGNVNLLFPQFTATEGLFSLDPDFVNVNNLFENNFCDLSRDSKYIVTGRGGIPLRPEDDFAPDHLWSDWRILDGEEEKAAKQTEHREALPGVKKIELIQGWTTDRQGRIVLTANPVAVTPQNSKLNTPKCNQ